MPTLIIDSLNYPYYNNYSKSGYKCLSSCVPRVILHLIKLLKIVK